MPVKPSPAAHLKSTLASAGRMPASWVNLGLAARLLTGCSPGMPSAIPPTPAPARTPLDCGPSGGCCCSCSCSCKTGTTSGPRAPTSPGCASSATSGPLPDAAAAVVPSTVSAASPSAVSATPLPTSAAAPLSLSGSAPGGPGASPAAASPAAAAGAATSPMLLLEAPPAAALAAALLAAFAARLCSRYPAGRPSSSLSLSPAARQVSVSIAETPQTILAPIAGASGTTASCPTRRRPALACPATNSIQLGQCPSALPGGTALKRMGSCGSGGCCRARSTISSKARRLASRFSSSSRLSGSTPRTPHTDQLHRTLPRNNDLERRPAVAASHPLAWLVTGG